MAYTFVKFPKKYLLTKEWTKPRKFTRAEALLYLISESEIPSNCSLAKVFHWSKTTVAKFLAEMTEQGYIGQKMDTLVDKKWTDNDNNNSELQRCGGQKMDTLVDKKWTHTKEIKNITPLIISSSKEESIICPPIGENENANLGFIKFQEWILKNAPRVARMKEPFTEIQYFAIKRDFDTDFICDLLMKMHNYEPLLTKNRNANLTFRNWAKRQQNNESSKPTFSASKTTKPSNEALLRAVANGISRARTEQ